MEVQIRPMELKDVEEVHAIDVLSFSLPWPERSYRFELTENPSTRLWVIEVAGENGSPRLAGMIVMWFVIDEAHIGTFAIHPDLRRQGIGRQLMQYALESARQAGVHKVFLEVRRSNLAAQKLYEDFGFHVDGIRLRYYHDTGEDALLMELNI